METQYSEACQPAQIVRAPDVLVGFTVALGGETLTAQKLETLKAWSAIVSAVAMPIVVAIVGFFVQRSLSSEGLKKDYVQIAISVLMQAPSKDGTDLRTWAIKVLEVNSPVPLPEKAKEDLYRLAFPVPLDSPVDVGKHMRCRQLQRELADKANAASPSIGQEEAKSAIECFLLQRNYSAPPMPPTIQVR